MSYKCILTNVFYIQYEIFMLFPVFAAKEINGKVFFPIQNFMRNVLYEFMYTFELYKCKLRYCSAVINV